MSGSTDEVLPETWLVMLELLTEEGQGLREAPSR